MNSKYITLENLTTYAEDWNALKPVDAELSELTSGLVLGGKYRLEKKAGEGGMGVVWKAFDLIGERWVALKLISPEIRHQEQAMLRVKQAFQTIQALNHTNICPIHALELDERFGYFAVMKWLEGKSLDAARIPVRSIPGILAKVASALDYVHKRGIIHRDVKPSNIFLEMRGKHIQEVFLIDFGLVSTSQASETVQMTGTPSFMPPEQWCGEELDGRTDQYALGVVAYTLYSRGKLPFHSKDSQYLRMLVMNSPMPGIPDVSEAINRVLKKVLSKAPAMRYSTCVEFTRALKEASHVQSENASQWSSVVWSFENNKAKIKPESPRNASGTQTTPSPEPHQTPKSREASKQTQPPVPYKITAVAVILGILLTILGLFVVLNALFTDKPESVSAPVPAPQSNPFQVDFRYKEILPGKEAGERLHFYWKGAEYAFRWCPPGEFQMGSERYEDEKPIHQVKLTRGFWLLETEVTQKMWYTITEKRTPGTYIAEAPVTNVSWEECEEFCRMFRILSEHQVMLPTEAQWEYACRAGSSESDANELTQIAWFNQNSNRETHHVGLQRPNAWGLRDMLGNVGEWCIDGYAKNYYANCPTNDPVNTRIAWDRVWRGGNFKTTANFTRPSYRGRYFPDHQDEALGFRFILVPDSEP